MSQFDIFPEMRRWLKHRIQQFFSIPDVSCSVLEIMAEDMEINHNSTEGVKEYYEIVKVMSDSEFKRRLEEAIKKIEEIKKKKIVAGVG